MDNDLQSFVSNASQNWAAAGVPVTEDAAPVDTTPQVDTSPGNDTIDPGSITPPAPAPTPNTRALAIPETHNWDPSLNDTAPEGPAPVEGEAQGNQPAPEPSPLEKYSQQNPLVSAIGQGFNLLGTGAQAVNQAARNVPGVAGAEDWLGEYPGQGLAKTLDWYQQNVADPLTPTVETGTLTNLGRLAGVLGPDQTARDLPSLSQGLDDLNPYEREREIGARLSSGQFLNDFPESWRSPVAVGQQVLNIANPAWWLTGGGEAASALHAGEDAAIPAAVRAAQAADAGAAVNPLTRLPGVGHLFEPEMGAAERAAQEDAAWRSAQQERLLNEQPDFGTGTRTGEPAQRFTATGEPVDVGAPEATETPAGAPRYRWQTDPNTGETRPVQVGPSDPDVLWERGEQPVPGVGNGERFPAFGDQRPPNTLSVGNRAAIPAAAAELDTAARAAQQQLDALAESTARRAALSRSASESGAADALGVRQMAAASGQVADRLASAADNLERQAQFLGHTLPAGLVENLHDTANTLRNAWQHPDPQAVDNRLAELGQQRQAMLRGETPGTAVEAPGRPVETPQPAQRFNAQGEPVEAAVAAPEAISKAPYTSKFTPEQEARYREIFGPEDRTVKPAAQASANSLVDSIDKGTLKPSETAGGKEIAGILKDTLNHLETNDPQWRNRPNLGRPGHEVVPALQRGAAETLARRAGFPTAEKWAQAQPATATSRISRLYNQIQRVAVEHWLATPGFLKHVTLSIGTLAGLHGVNPLGANPARLARLMPQLRDLSLLNHGAAASLWGEQASHGASQTRAVYQALERALGPAGKVLKPLEAVHAGGVEAVPHLTHGYEARVKAAAFQKYLPQAVREALKADPEALQTVGKMALPEKGVPLKVAREIGNFLHGAEGPESIKTIFDDARGRLSGGANTVGKTKDALDKWEQRAKDTLANASPGARARIADAQRIGTNASVNRIRQWMVNRANPTVLDSYAKTIFPFWHYDTQNPLIWGRTAMENPLLPSATQAYLKAVQGENAANNRPDRLKGYFNLPNVGQGTGDFMNPLRGLGFQKFLYPHKNDAGENASLGDQLLGHLGDVEGNAGFSPGLFPGLALTALSRALGGHPDPRDILPQDTWARYASNALTGGHGFDAEAPFKNLLYGTSQDKTYDYNVQKELLAQMLRGETPDLASAHTEAGKHALLDSMFAMFKHEDPEEQQYLDLAKQRRDLKASGDPAAVKDFDKAHPELFPWFSKKYGETPDQFAEKLGAGRDWTAPDGTKVHFNPDGSKHVEKPDGTAYNTTPGATATSPGQMSDKQYVASQFAAYKAIPEDDKVGRAKFLMDNAQSLRDHGFDKLDDDNTLQQRYWAATAKQAAANGDHDALQHASAQLAQLKGEEPKRVYRTDAENAEYNKIWDTYRGLTDSKSKAAFIAANKGRLTDLGYDFKDQTGQGGASSGGGRAPYRGYSRGGGSRSTYGRGGYSSGQNSDRTAWASQWNAYNSLTDPKAKAQYLIDHYDEINGLAAKLGKDGVKSTPGQLQVSMRKGDNTLPEAAPQGSVQSQVAWLGQNQARVDSINGLKDAATAAASGDSDAVSRLGALTEQHNNLFKENLEGLTPEQLADRALLAQEDGNQLKRYWAANANGPHDAIGHVFDQYKAIKNSGDRNGAAQYLDSHWDELLNLGYKPTFPRPNVGAFQNQGVSTAGGTGGVNPSGTATQGANVSNRYGSGSPASSNEAGFWNQYFGLKNSGDAQGARTLLDTNRDQVNAWRTEQGKAPLNPSFTRPAATTPISGPTSPNTGYAAATPPWQPAAPRQPRPVWVPAQPRQAPEMLPQPRAIMSTPGRQAAAPSTGRQPWLPATRTGGRATTGPIPVSRPQPMRYLQPKPARGYNVPTERKATGQRVSQ